MKVKHFTPDIDVVTLPVEDVWDIDEVVDESDEKLELGLKIYNY